MLINASDLKSIAPQGRSDIIDGLVQYFNQYANDYGITNYLRLCHFWAQAAEEADGFATLEEYASGAAYEGRRDLGNTQPGDGRRFKGRGIFMITGRANYQKYGKLLGVDLISNPKIASDPQIAVQTALEYWKDHGLNALADADDVNGITYRINGGYNGLSTRKLYLERAKTVFVRFNLSTSSSHVLAVEEIKKYQMKLISLGYTEVGNPDGMIGTKTKSAITLFVRDWNTNHPDKVIVDEGNFTPPIIEALDTAEPRGISNPRDGATVADLRNGGSKIIKASDVQKLGGGIIAAGAGAKGISDTLGQTSGTFDQVNGILYSLQTFMRFFNEWWWIPALIIGVIVLWQGYKIAKARLDDHITGNTQVINIQKNLDA